MISTAIKWFGWLCLALITTLACNSFDNLPAVSQPSITKAPVQPPTLSPTATLSNTVVTPTAISKIEATSVGVASIVESPIPTPVVDFDDLSPYRQAMHPDFVADVETVAAAGVSRYYLDVELDPHSFDSEQGLRLSGIERILYTNSENMPLNEIYLRLYPNLPGYGGQMSIDTIIIDDQSITPTLEAGDSALRVPLPSPLPPDVTVDISLTYRATVPSTSQQGYNIFSYSHGAVALAGFFPLVAVYDQNKGWDVTVPPPFGDATYLDISLFQVRFTLPKEMVVAASGSLLESQLNNDGTTKTVLLASGPMRDFYVVMREDYQIATETIVGTVINSYYPSDLEAGGQLALQYAVDAFRIFNKGFGQYPYAEFDVVATPTTAGGIEYPGIVVVNEQVYGLEGGFFEHATVHEVAHQWWYGLVGNDQIDEPWLDESLTNYSTILYWEEVRGLETASDIMAAFFFGPYEQATNQGLDQAVTGPVSAYSEGAYSAFVYGKGPLFFHALRQEIGDETYLKIMKAYYTDYKYKIATAQDLFRTIEQVSGRDVDPLIEMWLHGQ